MLLSTVLALTPTQRFRPSGFYGRYTQAWFLGEVDRYEPLLAKALHAGSGPRPYTVSDLWCENRPLAEGDVCYVRITSTVAPLSQFLMDKFPRLLLQKEGATGRPRPVRLYNILLEPMGRATWHQWNSESSFDALVAGASGPGCGSTQIMHFASPTSFHTNDGRTDLPLPVSDLVWGSLLRTWQVAAPPSVQQAVAGWWPQLSTEELLQERMIPSRLAEAEPDKVRAFLWPRFARACIAISDFRLHPQKTAFARGSKGYATGSTGYVVYTLLAAKRCGRYEALHAGAERLLNLLAQFALFSGVGHSTTQGLGQTRAVPNSKVADGRVMTPRYRGVEMG